MKRKQKNTKLLKLKKIVYRHLKLVFVPHGANQYRPHLVRRYGITTLLVLVISIQAVYNLSSSGSVLGAKAAISNQELLTDTNMERAKGGLRPLRISDRLSQAAFLKAKDMLEQQYWAHVAPDGTTPWHWLGVAGYNYAAAGENLAKGFTTADGTITAWMSSPAHRKNILATDYTDIGFAVVDGTLNGKVTTLVVALYGQPAAQPAILGASTPLEEASEYQTVSLVGRIGIALRSMTPAVIASFFMVLVATSVALIAQAYRHKLPKNLRQSWYRHHGLVKAGGMLSFMVLVLFLYSGGQI